MLALLSCTYPMSALIHEAGSQDVQQGRCTSGRLMMDGWMAPHWEGNSMRSLTNERTRLASRRSTPMATCLPGQPTRSAFCPDMLPGPC